jgi:hypothetical protein
MIALTIGVLWRYGLWVLLAAACLLLISLTFMYTRALRIRRRFLKRLKKLCREENITISEIKRPYASLFKAIPECNFTLEYQGRVFSCRLIGSWWQRAPLHFISKKHALYLHRVGTRTHHFTYECHFDYAFEGEGDKLSAAVFRSVEVSVSCRYGISANADGFRFFCNAITEERVKIAVPAHRDPKFIGMASSDVFYLAKPVSKEKHDLGIVMKP